MNKKMVHGYIRIFISAVMWGLIPVFTRLLYAAGYKPLEVASIRAYIGAFLAGLALVLSGELRRFRIKDGGFYLFYGLFAISGAFLFYALSMSMLSTAMAAVLLYTGPAFVIVLSRLLYRIKITPVKLFSLLLTIAGCALVVRIYDFTSFRASLGGILIGLLSGLCYSITTVLAVKGREKYSGKMNSWLILVFGMLPFLFVSPPGKVQVPEVEQWILLFGIAVCCSVFPYTIYLSAMGEGLDGGLASIIATVEPVAATLFGCLFFRDTLEWLQVCGIVVVILGVVLPLYGETASKKQNTKTDTGPVEVRAG